MRHSVFETLHESGDAIYRKDSIKRPGGYLTFINIWGALNRGGRLIKGGAYFIERESNGILSRSLTLVGVRRLAHFTHSENYEITVVTLSGPVIIIKYI